MARHDWVFAVGAGLCASLVPGCAQSLMQGSKSVGAPAQMRQGETEVVPTPVVSNSASPYHQLPKAAAAPAPGASEPLIAPVYSVTTMSRPEMVAQPPPVAEANVTDREPAQAKAVASAALTTVEAKPKPMDDPPLVAAVRSIVHKRPSEALALLGRYDKTSQDVLLCLLSLIARLSEGNLQAIDSGEASNMVTQLSQVTGTLRTQAALSIEKMCFCWHIDKFGVYRPLPADHEFRPGELVQVYVELQNFSSAAHGALYSIRTASQMEIREFDGRIVWHLGFEDREHPDLSQTQRHDFFNNYSFHVPKIPPGLYTLWLQVTDVPTGRGAEHTLDFRVVPARGL